MNKEELFEIDQKIVDMKHNWDNLYPILEVLNLAEMTYIKETSSFIKMMDKKFNSFSKIKTKKELKKIIKTKKLLRE